MTKNPYQSPSPPADNESDEASITDRLRKLREARKRWARRCWWIGILSVFGGLMGFNLSHVLFVEGGLSRWVTLIDIAAVSLIVFGGLTIVVGPIAWYWFRIRPVEKRNSFNDSNIR